MYGDGCERMNFLQDFINVYTENLTKKEIISKYIDESAINFKSELENYLKNYNLFANYKVFI